MTAVYLFQVNGDKRLRIFFQDDLEASFGAMH
jgi:hypothetical protein